MEPNQTSMTCWHSPSEQPGLAVVDVSSSSHVSAIEVVTPSTVVDKPARRRQVRRLHVGRDGIFPW